MGKKTWFALIVLLLVIIAGAAMYLLGARAPDTALMPPIPAQPSTALTAADAPSPTAMANAAIDDNTDTADATAESDSELDTEPLPALDASDDAVIDALRHAFGAPPIEAFLIPNRVIRRIVVTVDSLDRDPITLKQRPTAYVIGTTQIDARGDTLYLSPNNADRYDAFVSALDAADADLLIAAYRRYAPLFARAYRELGYPEGDFDARLRQVLDHLIATPAVTGPIVLLRPKVLYTYADPALERWSWGRKILIRVGPEHAATIQRKLTQLRRLLDTPLTPAD